MPNVAQLLTNITSLALVGATGAQGDQDRVLNYLNMAYRKVYRKIAVKYPFVHRTTQTVTITNGSGTLNPVPFFVTVPRDVNNFSRKLDPTDIEAVLDCDPTMASTGNPEKYWIEGLNALKTHPINSTSLTVPYIPSPDALDENTTEDEIKIPVVFHDILVWETLELMAYDERDKVVGAELAYNKDAHDQIYTDMWEFFDAQAPKEQKRVKAVLA